jgi:predicted lysophospholipase L1 biosynthesis ABC-type transport system permease subunit
MASPRIPATQHTREIAIRMALGAQPVQVIFATIRQALAIVIYGVVAGTFAASAIAKLVGSFLVSVSPFDPLTYAGVSALLAAIAVLASLLPALRASRVDPWGRIGGRAHPVATTQQLLISSPNWMNRFPRSHARAREYRGPYG